MKTECRWTKRNTKTEGVENVIPFKRIYLKLLKRSADEASLGILTKQFKENYLRCHLQLS